MCVEQIIHWIRPHKIGRFYEKYPSFFLTATHSFSYNLAIIQQITFADGLKPSHYTSARYTACRRYSRYILMDTFWFISIIVTPTPKIVKLRRFAKIIIFAQNKLFVVNYSLFFRPKNTSSSLLVRGYMTLFVWSNA